MQHLFNTRITLLGSCVGKGFIASPPILISSLSSQHDVSPSLKPFQTHITITQFHQPPQSKPPLHIASTPPALTHQASPTIMAPDADFHSQSDTTHSSLLALPDEVKLLILSNFYEDDKDTSNAYSFFDDDSDSKNALTLMILRRTHKSFRQMIPNPWKEARPTAEHLIAAERRYPYLFPFKCGCSYHGSCHSNRCPDPCFFSFPCYECLRVIKWGHWNGHPFDKPHNDSFHNYKVAYFRGKRDNYWGPCTERPGSAHAEDRICDKCWRRRLKNCG